MMLDIVHYNNFYLTYFSSSQSPLTSPLPPLQKHLLQLLCLGQCFGVQAYFCLNKDFTKTPFSDQTGKGEKGWGIFMQEVLVAERPKQSDMSHSAIIFVTECVAECVA